jgi:hypothetical protein
MSPTPLQLLTVFCGAAMLMLGAFCLFLACYHVVQLASWWTIATDLAAGAVCFTLTSIGLFALSQ